MFRPRVTFFTMIITCTRRLEFDYGHRVYLHESKCRHLHGHRGVVEVTVTAPGLDQLGRVIDFSVLKQRVGTWIDNNWDHNLILYENDFQVIAALSQIPDTRHPFLLPYNPTAENMARYLLEEVCPNVLGDTDVKAVRVKIWETPNGAAEACNG